MNEEEKEEIELDIEAKYVGKTEKEFLSRLTYEECIYILTPKNKYCDKIKELSVLKLCEITEKLQKENEKLRKQLNEENKRCMMLAIEKQDYFEKYRYNLQQNESLTKEFSNVIPIQKIKDKIEELDKAYEDSKDENGESEYYYPDYTIRVLEELLEKRK